MLKFHLLYTSAIDDAVAEAKLHGAQVTQIFTDAIFEVILQDESILNDADSTLKCNFFK